MANDDLEDCVTWEKPTASVNSEEAPLLRNDDQSDQKPVSKAGLIISLVILLASIPALIGAWCWPALVIGLLSGVASAAARKMGHVISLSVTGAMMVGVNIYMFYCAKTKRRRTHYQYVPFILTVLAGCLILLDLMRHVLADHHIWKPGPFPGCSQYRPNCGKENITCLSLTGVLFTIVATYTGFILLFIGTMWNANLISKLKEVKRKWQEIRKQK